MILDGFDLSRPDEDLVPLLVAAGMPNEDDAQTLLRSLRSERPPSVGRFVWGPS